MRNCLRNATRRRKLSGSVFVPSTRKRSGAAPRSDLPVRPWLAGHDRSLGGLSFAAVHMVENAEVGAGE